MKRLHWYYKFLIVFLIVFSMFFLLNKNMSKIVNSSSYKDYINFISIPFSYIEKYNIFKYKKVIKENDILKKRNLYLENKKYKNDSLELENKQLKQELSLKKTYNDYNIIYAKTVIRNKMYWFSTITIDKGSEDGIKEGNAVISSYGLIGSIKSVTRNHSTVKLITNSDTKNKISVSIKNNKEAKVGAITGYKYPYILIEIEDVKSIKNEDQVITSGLSNFPKDIYIGNIKEIKKDEYKVSTILYVEPKQDMNDITYVGVLTDK